MRKLSKTETEVTEGINNLLAKICERKEMALEEQLAISSHINAIAEVMATLVEPQIPITEMNDEQIWDKFGGMSVKEFLEASPQHQGIDEICRNVPCDISGFTEEEENYIAESLIRTILAEPISSFIHSIIPKEDDGEEMQFTCTHCHYTNSAKSWNIITEARCGGEIEPIEEASENSNFYYICPYCKKECSKGEILLG
jgi:hypothetical protein